MAYECIKFNTKEKWEKVLRRNGTLVKEAAYRYQ
jgi:hypothetical protein